MTVSVPVRLKRLPNGQGLPLPTYMTDGAAGADVCAAVADAMTLAPNERALIPTGFAFGIPDGYEIQIRPRSGLALRSGITVLNTPGCVDSDYVSEVGVILINHSDAAFEIRRGDRIAQLILAPVVRATFRETDELPPTSRGAGGFGSTGHSATPAAAKNGTV